MLHVIIWPRTLNNGRLSTVLVLVLNIEVYSELRLFLRLSANNHLSYSNLIDMHFRVLCLRKLFSEMVMNASFRSAQVVSPVLILWGDPPPDFCLLAKSSLFFSLVILPMSCLTSLSASLIGLKKMWENSTVSPGVSYWSCLWGLCL